MKKILSLVLVAMMVFSFVPATFAADSAEDSNYQEALDFLGNVGFYQGGNGVTAKDDITRWQMALFVDRLVTGQVDNSYWATTENNSGFTDVDQYTGSESYILGAITYAAQQGIITGDGDGTFRPNDGITYRDAIVMTVRALGINYPASGYPWSYIKTGRELGLMDGIENGIGWEDEIAREVVVQILYNAFFADVDGAVVAEDVFGIGKATIMVTGSKNVCYDEFSSEVLANNYVQISAVDAQGEPTGTKYHVPASMLGLADVTAENAAVGDYYSIYYKDNYYSIVMAECLTADYENRGNDKAQFSYNATANTVTVDGVSTYTVGTYTNLFNQNVPASTATLMAESKVFLYGGLSISGTTVGQYFYMQADGKIFTIAPLTITTSTQAQLTFGALEFVGYYSEFLGGIYAWDSATSSYVVDGDLFDAIVEDLTNISLVTFGQTTASRLTNDYAYADITASDINNDGTYDRVALKAYSFGIYRTWTDTKSSGNSAHLNKVKFYIDDTNGLNSMSAIAGNDSAYVAGGTNGNSVAYKVEDFRFTGVQASALKNGDFVLYYLDELHNEIDVLTVINKKGDSTTDTYWSTGYVLGFFQSSNLVYIDDGADRGSIAIGYDNLAGSPLYTFKSGSSYTTANNALITELLTLQEQYVTYVVVDDKVVYIKEATAANDFVIIDEFVNVDTNGITAKVWSTVAGGADTINITEFNGWNIKGFDWTAYWQSGLFQGILNGQFNPSAFLSQFIPVKAGEIYRVVYYNGSNYNLTTATPSDTLAAGESVFVQYGYIHNLYNNVYNNTSAGIVATTANDFWMIREELADGSYKVYARNGKIASTSFGEGVEIYKASANDYVISGTTEQLKSFLSGVQYTDTDVQFVTYQVYPGWTDTDIVITDQGYFFGRNMTNILTGNTVGIKYDPTNVAAIKAGLEMDKIYMAVGGVLYDTTALEIGDVAEYLAKTNTYAGMFTVDANSEVFTSGALTNDNTAASVRRGVYSELVKKFYPAFTYTQIATNDNFYKYIAYTNTTVISFAQGAAAGQKYVKFAFGADPAAWTNGSAAFAENWVAYVFYNADMKATILVDYGATVTTATATATTSETGITATAALTSWAASTNAIEFTFSLAGDTTAIDTTVAPVVSYQADGATEDVVIADAVVSGNYTVTMTNDADIFAGTFYVVFANTDADADPIVVAIDFAE